MAEENSPFGQWGTISFEIPDFLEDTRQTINEVAELLVASLDVAIQALNLVKAFSVSYIDPMSAIVKLLIDEVRAFIDDFRQLGLYITGDWALDVEDLQGGFGAYESRMVGRLTDRTDPTRPDVSSGTTVAGAFFYVSTDFSGVERVTSFIKLISDLFRLSFSSQGTLPVPTITNVEYGSATLGTFGTLENLLRFDPSPPGKVRISWRVNPTSTKHPFNPFPSTGPGGFLVTVSTLPDGIRLMYDRPQRDAGKEKGKNNQDVQPREYGEVRDMNGQPVVLYGGADMIKAQVGSHVYYNEAVEEAGKLRDNVGRVYGVRSLADNAPIPLEYLKGYFQKTFYVGLDQVSAEWATREYSITIDIKDLPKHATFVVGNAKNEAFFQAERAKAQGQLAEVRAKIQAGTGDLEDLRQQEKVLVDAVESFRVQGSRAKGQIPPPLPAANSTFYVRVASTTAEVGNQDKQFRYDLARVGKVNSAISGKPYRVPLTDGLSPDSISAWSAPQIITVPNVHTDEFVDGITAALIVLALSRSDLPIIDSLEQSKGKELVESAKAHRTLVPQVALRPTGLEPFAKLLDAMYPDFRGFIEAPGMSPKEFRQDLLTRCRRMAQDLYEKVGTRPEVVAYIVDNTQALRLTSWKEILLAAGEAGMAQVVKRDGNLIDFLSETNRFAALEKEAGLTSSEFGPGAFSEYGVAANPYSMGVSPEDVEALFKLHPVIRGRKPDFIEMDAEGEEFVPEYEISAQDAPGILALAPPGLKLFYEKYREADGSIVIPSEVVAYLEALKKSSWTVGSADRSPVFFTDVQGMRELVRLGATKEDVLDFSSLATSAAVFCRSLLGQYKDGVLYREAALVLGVAASVFRRPLTDGEWASVRFFDAFPGLEDFFSSIENWLGSLSNSLQGVADAVVSYIEFIEARLVDLQQLIARVNALIESLLGFSVAIPQCSALLVLAQGTDGVLSQLITAQNKPSDSPLSYGGGIGVLAPVAPAFIMDLLTLKDGSQDLTKVVEAKVISGLGVEVEAVPAEELEVPDDEPDVL